jgi:WD40 repeat protein
VYALAFSADGRLLVSGSNKNTICLWDVQSGVLIREMEGHATWVMSVAFNLTDTLIASGGLDGTVKIWDVQTGSCLQTVRAHGPYAGMNITGVTGIPEAQKAALRALGAVGMRIEVDRDKR